MDMAPTQPHGGCLASWLYFHGTAEEDMLGCGVSLDHLRGMRLLPHWSETRPLPYNHREDLGRPAPELSLPGKRTEWGSQGEGVATGESQVQEGFLDRRSYFSLLLLFF